MSLIPQDWRVVRGITGALMAVVTFAVATQALFIAWTLIPRENLSPILFASAMIGIPALLLALGVILIVRVHGYLRWIASGMIASASVLFLSALWLSVAG